MDSFGPRSGAKTMSSGVFWPDDPHISLLPSSKVQMHKCKCGREFCCYMNYRRHNRSHRPLLPEDQEDLRNERQSIAAFLSKLPDDTFKRILDVNYKIEELCGATAKQGLERLVHVPSFSFYAHNYYKSGSALHDTVQKQQVSSAHELLNLLDEATEKTFLSGRITETVVRYMLEGAGGKTSFDDKMHIASVALLVEHNLVNAWLSAKAEQARLAQEALEKEEDDAQRKQRAMSQRKLSKKQRQKEKKALTEETEDIRMPLSVGEELTAESSPKGSEKLAVGREPRSDRVAEPLAEEREVTITEDLQDSGGWQKQGKARWADMVEPTHNRRNWSRNSRQDNIVNRVNAYSGSVTMKQEQNNHRPRPKSQRATTGMLPGARPTAVKLPSNVVWARKAPAESGREDATLPAPPPAATGLSTANAPPDTAVTVRTPEFSAASSAPGVWPPPNAATGVSGLQAVESLPPVAGTSAAEAAPLLAADVAPATAIVPAEAAPVSAADVGPATALSAAEAVPATALSAAEAAPSTATSDAEAPPSTPGIEQEDGMNVIMIGTLKVPWSASRQELRNGLVTPADRKTASVDSEVTSSAIQTVGADQSSQAKVSGPAAESVGADECPSGGIGSRVFQYQITYEEFMCKRWEAALTDPNAVVLKLGHEPDTGSDLKAESR